jgi:hypothetical protein
MTNMHFEYEITVDEYVAAQLLYQKLCNSRERIRRGVWWLLVGLLFIVVAWNIAWNEKVLDLGPFLLGAVGGWWVYAGVVNLFPARYLRGQYQKAELAGKTFKADLSEEGFEVSGDECNWRVRWRGVRVKGENESVLVLYGANTVFIFGKKYLSHEQQQEFRKLAGL